MSERLELSFKNKEVRIWFVMMMPAVIVGALIMFFVGIRYQYVAVLLILMAWVLFYIWRYFYMKKQREESSNTYCHL